MQHDNVQQQHKKTKEQNKYKLYLFTKSASTSLNKSSNNSQNKNLAIIKNAFRDTHKLNTVLINVFAFYFLSFLYPQIYNFLEYFDFIANLFLIKNGIDYVHKT